MARTKPPACDIVHGDVSSGARFDSTGAYRYHLWRRWDAGPSVCFIMLNPSTADATRDDPTIRRCIRFARDWGFPAVDVVNLFAYRATQPTTLRTVSDPVGRGNERTVTAIAGAASVVIAAWGASPIVRDPTVPGSLHCLALNRDGSPRHPLYVRADVVPIPYSLG